MSNNPWIFQFYSVMIKSGIIHKESSGYRRKQEGIMILGLKNGVIGIKFCLEI